MKRIAIGQIQQETNTFNPSLTTRADFENFGWAEGENVLDRYGDSGEFSGFRFLPEELGGPVEWLGLVRAKEVAGGPVDDLFLKELAGQLESTLSGTEIDGVLLSLHGALASPEIPDVEGWILGKIRALIGPEIPLVATLDLHANITVKMIEEADVLVGYHTFPHIDHKECGRRAARALAQLLKYQITIRVSAAKIPMVVNTRGFTTDSSIMMDLYQRMVDAENNSETLSVGLYMAQPWLDVPELGWTFYQAYCGREPPLDAAAVVEECWEKRKFNKMNLPGPDEVISQALAIDGRPIAISEGHDATNSGAPGDSTRFLGALLERNIPAAGALTFCVDSQSVEHCLEAGEDSEIVLKIGATTDPYSQPLEVSARVKKLGSVRFTHSGHGGHNLKVDMGRAAVIRSGSTTVVLTERKGLGSSPKLYQSLGLDPRKFKIVIAKSPEGFRNDYEPIAADFLYSDAPGCASANLIELEFNKANRPLFPLDEFENLHDAHWTWKIDF